MTIQQIGYFIRLAEELNYTLVARMFFITQPTLSRQIVNLENEVNVTLFVREHNGVKLTVEGEHFYNRIKPIYQDLTAAIEETQHIRKESVHVTIGLQEEQLISSSIVIAMRRLQQKYPDVQINILRGTPGFLFEGLQNGKFDMINMLKYPEKNLVDESFEFLKTQDESTYMVIAKEVADHDKLEISKQEFQEYCRKYPVILPELFEHFSMSRPREILEETYGMQDMEIQILQRGTPISIPVQVASGIGISISNKTNMFSIDPEICMYRIQDTEKSYLKGIFYPEHITSPYAKTLIRFVKEEIKKYTFD